jgi:pyruvate-formate lyase-activating enzyme
MAHEAGKDLFVKIVVTAQTDSKELAQACEVIRRVDPGIPLVLQPVTPWGLVKEEPAPEQLDQWKALARDSLLEVKVIPQVHRLLGVP